MHLLSLEFTRSSSSRHAIWIYYFVIVYLAITTYPPVGCRASCFAVPLLCDRFVIVSYLFLAGSVSCVCCLMWVFFGCVGVSYQCFVGFTLGEVRLCSVFFCVYTPPIFWNPIVLILSYRGLLP